MTGSTSAPAASSARTAAAAAGALAVAVDLLGEAARLGASGDRTAAEERRRVVDEAAALLPRLPRLLGDEGFDDVHRALADCALVAREVAHLAEFLASCDKRPCPRALAAARLAETSVQMVVDAVVDEDGRSAVDELSQRARQLVEIHEIETRLDAAVARLAQRGVKGSSERRTFQHSRAPRLSNADWDA